MNSQLDFLLFRDWAIKSPTPPLCAWCSLGGTVLGGTALGRTVLSYMALSKIILSKNASGGMALGMTTRAHWP